MKRLTMKRLAVATAAATLLVTTGCGSGDKPTAHPSSPATDSPRAAYHRLVREDVAYFSDRTDAQLDTIGRKSCKVLAGQDGWVVLVKVLTDTGVNARDAGEFIAYATATFCPELEGKLPS